MNRAAAIADQNVFSLAHPEFYESLAYRELSPEYRERVKALLPETWTLRRNDVWVHALSNDRHSSTATSVTQGFKIHVSSAPKHTLRVLDIIVPICGERIIDFKLAGDPSLHNLINSKLQGRGYSGKFMTIYPTSEQVFKDLIEELYLKTKDEGVAGPYILSDRRYKDSRILFYRYGEFLPPHRLNIDGSQTSFLVAPSGEFISDQRLPYFHLPEWVRDPFVEAPSMETEEGTLLNDRYRVEGAINFSNAGGVYYGDDTTTGKPVVIKEARPFTNCWNVGEGFLDAIDLLKHEYAVLRRLEGLDCTAAPIDLFQDWEHTFLVEERITGITLEAFWAQDDDLLAPYILREGRIERFLPKFKFIAEAMINMVKAVHERGVLLGDLSPRNILIDTETLRMSLIDFESAVLADDQDDMLIYATNWGTPGFVHPTRTSRKHLLPEDDFYAIAMVLYSGVIPVNYFFALNPGAETLFLDKFIEMGVPIEVKQIITSLQSGALAEAQQILAGWNLEN